MPSLKRCIENKQCIINITIRANNQDNKEQSINSFKSFIESGTQFKALIDTGAQGTCISKGVSESLGLVSRSLRTTKQAFLL